jgi:hypothetical protein
MYFVQDVCVVDMNRAKDRIRQVDSLVQSETTVVKMSCRDLNIVVTNIHY